MVTALFGSAKNKGGDNAPPSTTDLPVHLSAVLGCKAPGTRALLHLINKCNKEKGEDCQEKKQRFHGDPPLDDSDFTWQYYLRETYHYHILYTRNSVLSCSNDLSLVAIKVRAGNSGVPIWVGCRPIFGKVRGNSAQILRSRVTDAHAIGSAGFSKYHEARVKGINSCIRQRRGQCLAWSDTYTNSILCCAVVSLREFGLV